ncbi:MAG: TIGR01244 family phosphatase [Bordetella sp.]|nr:TIGR01244 family phosphatase [Bordetella sp.]
MDIRPLEPRLHVSPQIQPEDIPTAAAQGYRAIISNRPDGEEPGQPMTEDIRAAAEAAGLSFVHIPIRGGAMAPDDAARFKAALAELPQPILGYCRSGTRTTFLWALSQAGERPAQEIVALAAAAGYDVSPLGPRLQG